METGRCDYLVYGKEDGKLCEKALFPLFVIAMKSPHFCHPMKNPI